MCLEFELGAQRNLGSIQRKAMLAPSLSRNHPPPSLLVYVGEPPVVWQGTVDSYHRHLHSWDRGQLMAGGSVAGKEPDTPAPPGMSGHHRRVGYRWGLEVTCKQGKPSQAI